jgi:ABC-type uncharacterized transport system auxiliary subunit
MRPSGKAKPRVNLHIESLGESEALARKAILIKKRPTQIEYYTLDQWTGTLGAIVTQKLETEFGPRIDGAKTIVLTGAILDFGQVDVPEGAQVCARRGVEFHEKGASRHTEALDKRTYERVLPAGDRTAATVVEALSRCMESITADMASDTAKF